MKYNLSRIMSAAWRLFRKGVQSFAAALRMAWANAKAHRAAKAAAGITEEAHTWAGWHDLGFEVIHESKALYKALFHDPSTKKGVRVTCYFGASQVQPIGTQEKPLAPARQDQSAKSLTPTATGRPVQSLYQPPTTKSRRNIMINTEKTITIESLMARIKLLSVEEKLELLEFVKSIEQQHRDSP